MNFKVNDLVRVKSFEEIKKTLDADGYYYSIYFNPGMKRLCSKIFRVEKIENMKPQRVRLKAVDGSQLPVNDYWMWDADWLTPANNTIFSIDVSDLEKAIEEVKRLHEESKPKKHRLTEGELRAVKSLMGAYAAEAIEKGCSIVFYTDRTNKTVTLRTYFGSEASDFSKKYPRTIAYCSPKDEFNPLVGKFVCLCKLLGKPISEWV